jgi:hypothetical protein
MSQHGINHKAYIGLGSNMADPVAQVREALDELAHLPLSRLLAVSSLYRSAPVGKLDQPDFINAVALIETALKLSILTGACANTAMAPGPSISTSSYMTTCNAATPTSPCRTHACINARLFCSRFMKLPLTAALPVMAPLPNCSRNALDSNSNEHWNK